MRRASTWLQGAGWAVLALAVLAYLGYLVIYSHYAFSLFRFPFDYDQGEGFELYDTLLHSQWQWPYRDSSVFPFYTSIYPPLFHVLTVPLVWLFGPKLWTGRLVGYLASLATGAAIGWAVHRETRVKPIAILSGLAFLASNYVYHIGPLFRQHMTMVMFETLAIVVLAGTSHQAKPRRRTIALGLVLLLAAGFTKQLAIASAIAAFAFLFIRGPRRALVSGVLFSGAFLALFLGINASTDGHWYTGVVLANVNEYSFDQAVWLFHQWAGLHAVILLLSAAWLVYEIYGSRLSAYGIWFFFAVVNGLTAGKFGAGESYFVTAIAAACVLSGIATGKVWERAHQGRPAVAGLFTVAVALAYLWQAWLVLHLPTRGPIFEPVARLLRVPTDLPYYDSQGYTQLGRPPDEADIRAGWLIAEHISRSEKPPLSEEAGFPLAVGRPVVSNPFPQLMMYRSGLLDVSEFVRQIDEQAFGVVILRAQFYPPPLLEAMGRAYQPAAEIQMNGFVYRILEPRPR